MKIKKVTDPEFSRYGRVIDGYDFSKLIKAMEHTPLPEDVIYEHLLKNWKQPMWQSI